MGAFDSLLNRLHRVFDKDPAKVPAVVVTCDAVTEIKIKDLIVRVEGAGTITPLDISTGTVSDLVATLNTIPGVAATLGTEDVGTLMARGLVEGSAILAEKAATVAMFYPTSQLWSEMRPVGWSFDQQAERLNLVERQMYLDTATGDWLKYWGASFFGVEPYPGETDENYGIRIINEVIRPNQNNVALELILQQAMGVAATIRDAYPLRDQIAVEDQAKTPGHFLLDLQIPNDLSPTEANELLERCKTLVRKYKASGTDFFQTVLSQVVARIEEMTVEEVMAALLTATVSESPQPGKIRVGAGWRVGTPGLKVGTNDAIKEQIFVRTLNAADSSLAQANIYGG